MKLRTVINNQSTAMTPHLQGGSGTTHSWIFSLLLHTAGVMAAGSLLAHLQLAPQPEPLHLHVAFVEPLAGASQGTSASAVHPPVEPSSSHETAPVTQPAPDTTDLPVESAPADATAIAQPRIVERVPPDRLAEPDVRHTNLQEIKQAVRQVQLQEYPSPVHAPAPAEMQPARLLQTAPSSTTTPISTPQSEAVADSTQNTQVAMNIGGVGRNLANGTDHGWLIDALRQRVEQSKRYPRLARKQGWQGRVVIKAVIREDGSLSEAYVKESSGYEVLDLDAVELIKEVCPLNLRQALGQSHVVVHLPIHYRIEQ